MEVTNPLESLLDLLLSILVQLISAQYQAFFAIFEILEYVGVIA